MRILPVLLALPLVMAYGVAEGRWTNRWSTSDALEQAAARLAGVPRTVGEWDGSDEPLDPRQVAGAEITGYLLRRYVHRGNGATVTMLLVCGRPGPTSVHTPERCFTGNGYNQAAPAQRAQLDAPGSVGPAGFWSARFQQSGNLAEPLQVLWSWNAEGRWGAPDYPRLEFGRYAFLYKLYLIQPAERPEQGGAGDQSAAFAAAFLPEVHKALFAAP